MSSESEGTVVLREVVLFLESLGLRYWLGRGRFRHFTLTHEFGDADSDIDFHLLRGAEVQLQAALPQLQARGYMLTDGASRHKLSLRKEAVAVEFVYLDPAPNAPEAYYHETAYPLRKRFTCPARLFGDRRLEILGVSVRVPEEEYLPCVFGPRWRENVKGSGGVQI